MIVSKLMFVCSLPSWHTPVTISHPSSSICHKHIPSLPPASPVSRNTEGLKVYHHTVFSSSCLICPFPLSFANRLPNQVPNQCRRIRPFCMTTTRSKSCVGLTHTHPVTVDCPSTHRTAWTLRSSPSNPHHDIAHRLGVAPG
jgi:hypothetical protein